MDPQQQQQDLSRLPHPTEDNLTAILSNRFQQGQYYTRIASSVVVQVNPNFPGRIELSEASLQDQVLTYKDGARLNSTTNNNTTSSNSSEAATRIAASPQAIELATSAYLHMRRTGQDQSIITSGQSGSGKTEGARQVIRQLLALSSAPKKEARVQNQITSAGLIMEAFGHAKTSLNDNASRVGRFTELQFNERGRLVGAKMLDYFLEKKRISRSASTPDERNFHIFYQLLAGATVEEKTHLRLTEGMAFHYLSPASLNRNRTLSGMDDAVEFGKLKNALKVLGFQKRQVAQIFQLLAAVLHLGNLTFMEDSSHTNDACVVRNVDSLIFVADILGVDPNALQNTLTYKTKLIKKELCSVFLDAQGAEAQRDELAQALYSLLFSWMVEFFNVKLCDETPANFIGVVDMFGFQQFTVNGLDQFCVNYSNERLHQFFLNRVFEADQADFELEGISESIPRINFFDNSACLQMLGQENGEEGLIGIMSSQSRHLSRKTDATMLEAFSKQYSRHDSLTVTRNMNVFPSFTVQHYLAPVTYRVEGWLEQNVDNLSSDFVTLFRGGPGVSPSMNPFVQGLFTDKALTTESHPRNNNTIVAAQQSIKPKRAPSMRRPKKVDDDTNKEKSEIASAKATPTAGEVVSMAAQIQSATQELCDSLEETTPWFLVCLKSNETNMPNHVDAITVKAQVRSLCLAQISQRLAIEYTISCTHQEFLDRYTPLYVNLLEDCAAAATTKTRMDLVYADEKWTVQDANVGKYRVYIAERAWRELEYRLKNETDKKGKKDGVEQSASAVVGAMGFQQAANEASGLPIPMLPYGNGLETPGSFRGEILNMSEDDQSINSNTAMAAPLLLQQQHLQQHQELLHQQQMMQQQQQNPYLFQQQQQQQHFNGLHPAQASFMANERLENRSFYSGDDNQSEYDPYMRGTIHGGNGAGGNRFENESVYGGSEIYRPNTRMFSDAEKRGMMRHMDGASPDEERDDALGKGQDGTKEKGVEDEDEEKIPITRARRNWVFLTYALTWWIPSFCLNKCGKMVRPDIRMAWREKVALCILIGFLSLIMVFYIAVLGELICPHQYVYSMGELSTHGDKSGSPFTMIRGEIFDMNDFMTQHNPNIVSKTQLLQYAGRDATPAFPVQVSALCDGLDGYGAGTVDPLIQMPNQGPVDPNAVYHDFRASRNDSRPDWYYEKMVFMRQWRVGFLAFTPKDIQIQAADDSTKRRWAILDGNVYDMTAYIQAGNQGQFAARPGGAPPAGANAAFMDQSVVQLFATSAGEDVTTKFNALPLEAGKRTAMLICLRNLFFVGRVDLRTGFRCQFANYMLLVPSILIVCTIGFKFLAALQLGSRREPEEHDKFIILQVPCYTEGEESLRKTLDSLAALRYDDKRKLLFVIADGMIIGSGNDRPTPRIVLDILGVDPNVDPEPLSFLSLGEGHKQHNMGKVYSGLYEHNGHIVPYIVVVKVGTPTERQRPGNRGKRDSQMILMRFLNKVHFNSAMTPMELEMFHQIKNVIGVNPSFYEYTLMVDSDTEVLPDSLNRMVSVFLHDTKVMGLCGETQIANEKDSWVTMMQVYEYFISHHLAKAFESLFGSVTCLPGCFCMYRIRTPTKSTPLLISNSIIDEYSENRVDTLHKKNLLHLGEDRYLTTLMLKHFPNYKMTFTPDAQCRTNVPDQWKVLLSQRRRWINSTVHNLMELVFLPQLCGFCCFSMRFIVMIDLFATLIMPVTVVYIGYLIYTIASHGSAVPKLALIMMGAVYGLQAVIFILRRKWEHIGWMIVYILAIPMFSFYLPLYSFWHFDDFSWGNTRLVVGEKGRTKAVSADQLDGKAFDPKSIPQKKWSDYEQELWEVGSTHSLESKGSRFHGGQQFPYSNNNNSGLHMNSHGSRAGSVYGGANNDLAAMNMGMPLSMPMAVSGGPFMGMAGAGGSRPQSPAMGMGMNPPQIPGTPTRSYSPAPQFAYQQQQQLQQPVMSQQGMRNSWGAGSVTGGMANSPGHQRMSMQSNAPLSQYQMQLLQQQQQQQQQGPRY
ncbi:glycosyltransferase family 2 protein [Linnemannia elongata AG-77]|uniref:chitin synthase n=1 Tax=Linnemannia elongata AG-77 TaxID=1314771 RepID=A0A197JX61_9FUNG|nr:glycosyltransferase family 2 protein [Linnemannia elongata AG-77]